MTDSLIADFLLNLAAGLTQSLLSAGSARLQQAALGTEEERALKTALHAGFAALLADVENQLSPGHLHTEHSALARHIFADFVRQPPVAESLLSMALAGTPPDLAGLAAAFDALDFDRKTLTVNFDGALIAFHQGLTTTLVAKARQEGSAIFNQVSLGRTLTIQALLESQQRSLADIATQVQRLEKTGPQTIYNVIIENATGLAVGDKAFVTQTDLSPETQALLSEILGILREMRSIAPPRTLPLDSEQLDQLARLFVRLLQSTPGAKQIAGGAKAKLESVHRQIQQVAEYKETHDLLQQLDQSSNVARDLIYENDTMMEAERLHWRGLQGCCGMVQIGRQKLDRYVQDAFFAQDATDWLAELDLTGEQLALALDNQDVALLDEALYEMRDVVSQQTSRFNDRLMGAIDGLYLADLVEVLRELYRDLEANQTNDEQNALYDLDRLDDILTRFAALAERLVDLRREHDHWQQIDNKLRPELQQLAANLPRFKRRWQSILRTRIIERCRGVEVDWAHELKQSISQVDNALEQDAPNATSVAVYACHGAINRRFIQVDVDLKRLCGVLATAGNSLDTILDIIG